MLEVFLLIFKSSRWVNYAIEAFTTIFQYHLLLPDRLAKQLLWSRFVNTHGQPGHNIPCDLYMEHCNRVCKMAVRGIGANVTPQAIQRVGKCAGPLLNIIDQFDSESGIGAVSTGHTVPSFNKDLGTILKQLATSQVCKELKGRKHTYFKSLRGSIINCLDYNHISWMQQQMDKRCT